MRAKKSKGRKGERERERCRWQRSSMWLRSQVKCSPTSRIMCSTTTSTRHGEAKLGKHNMPLCCRHVVDHVCVDCQQRPLFCTRTPYTPAHLAHLHTLHASFWFGDFFFFSAGESLRHHGGGCWQLWRCVCGSPCCQNWLCRARIQGVRKERAWLFSAALCVHMH